MSMESFLVTVAPEQLREVQALPVTPVHLAYRMGKGPHLFRISGSAAPRGGLMLLDGRSFDGFGPTPPFCQEVVRECMARGFTGVVCDFEGGRLPPLEQIVRELGSQCFRRSWLLLVPEQYGHCSPHAQVYISSALSGGTLTQRLRDCQERFGRDRIVLALQRTAEDFFLPSPTGSGIPLTQEELQARIRQRNPSVFFSHELCARYFTYMSQESGAHFVLFDDAATLAQKLQVARSLEIRTVLAAWPEIADAVQELGLRPAAPGRPAGFRSTAR